jgi:hypothetical protein
MLRIAVFTVSFTMSVTYKPFMLSAIMLNEVMLRVVAPAMRCVCEVDMTYLTA